MILQLSTRYKRRVALTLYLSFYFQVLSTMAADPTARITPRRNGFPEIPATVEHVNRALPGRGNPATNDRGNTRQRRHPMQTAHAAQTLTGGPVTPEASSFKSVNADNLVNLFTGDFSYSIPLLDVGGYPVNIFYNGGITMEQEASWVGLGWNINPGSISRSMRGVPDDFDGSDTLVQVMNVKPNKTWSGMIGVDGEALGIKSPNVNLSLGFSYNNYLGPELDLGAGVSVAYPIMSTIVDVHLAPLDSVQGLSTGAELGLNAKLSSRSGLTLNPSLNANLALINLKTDAGVGLSTSYNSRTGIQSLDISGQVSHDAIQLRALGAGFNLGIPFPTYGTVITFARPSYVPTLRMPMLYTNYSGQVELGAGMFGRRRTGGFLRVTGGGYGDL